MLNDLHKRFKSLAMADEVEHNPEDFDEDDIMVISEFKNYYSQLKPILMGACERLWAKSNVAPVARAESSSAVASTSQKGEDKKCRIANFMEPSNKDLPPKKRRKIVAVGGEKSFVTTSGDNEGYVTDLDSDGSMKNLMNPKIKSVNDLWEEYKSGKGNKPALCNVSELKLSAWDQACFQNRKYIYKAIMEVSQRYKVNETATARALEKCRSEHNLKLSDLNALIEQGQIHVTFDHSKGRPVFYTLIFPSIDPSDMEEIIPPDASGVQDVPLALDTAISEPPNFTARAPPVVIAPQEPIPNPLNTLGKELKITFIDGIEGRGKKRPSVEEVPKRRGRPPGGRGGKEIFPRPNNNATGGFVPPPKASISNGSTANPQPRPPPSQPYGWAPFPVQNPYVSSINPADPFFAAYEKALEVKIMAGVDAKLEAMKADHMSYRAELMSTLESMGAAINATGKSVQELLAKQKDTSAKRPDNVVVTNGGKMADMVSLMRDALQSSMLALEENLRDDAPRHSDRAQPSVAMLKDRPHGFESITTPDSIDSATRQNSSQPPVTNTNASQQRPVSTARRTSETPVRASPRQSANKTQNYQLARGLKSVEEIWEEYAYGLNGGPAVSDLEKNDPEFDFKGQFYRKHRLPIYKFVTEAAETLNVSGEEVAKMLQGYRERMGSSDAPLSLTDLNNMLKMDKVRHENLQDPGPKSHASSSAKNNRKSTRSQTDETDEVEINLEEDDETAEKDSDPSQYELPHLETVTDVWCEYKKGLNTGPAVEQLDKKFGSAWRSKSRTLYAERKKFYEFISKGCKSLKIKEDLVAKKLEGYRVRMGLDLTKLAGLIQKNHVAFKDL
ncbi:Transcription factor [Phlyctochytrium bullatum]|nr:Transcription factor [Phlyctochytrium bullatum]